MKIIRKALPHVLWFTYSVRCAAAGIKVGYKAGYENGRKAKVQDLIRMLNEYEAVEEVIPSQSERQEGFFL